MDIQQPNRPGLEPIQEESELEDETEGNRTREANEGDFPFQVGVEEEDALAEDESDKDDDAAQLRILRPGRLSRSLSQLTNHPHKVTESFPVSDVSTLSFDLCGEATTPGQPKFTNIRRSNSSKVKIKVSKIKWQKPRRSKRPVQKPRERCNKNFMAEEPFPPWLADLMVSIEEATTHQLVVE